MNKIRKTIKASSSSQMTAIVNLIDMEPDTDLKHPPKPNQKVTIKTSKQGIFILPEGYGDYDSFEGQGTPILIEQCRGVVRVVVWGDINDMEPTHIVDIEGAKEDNRNDIK